MIKNNVKKIHIILMLLCILVGCVQPTEVSSKKQVEPSKQVIEVDSPIGGIAQINQNGKIGYQKEDGTILVNPTYDLSDPSPEEHENYRLLGKSQENGTVLWGHVTGTGIVVEPQFDKPYTFFENVIVPNSEIFQLAFVYQNGEGGIIKQNGEWFIEIGIYLFKEQVGNLAVVSEKEFPTKLGVIPGNGGYETLIPFMFDTIDIREESISVTLNGMNGTYSMEGNLNVDPIWKTISLQEDGYLIVSKDKVPDQTVETGTEGVIKLDGSIVLDPIYATIYEKHDGYRVILDRNHKYGYINENYQIVVEPQYEYGGDFSEGLAYVEKDESTSFIDRQGNVLFEMPENYTLITPFKNGIGLVTTDTLTYYYSFEAGEKNIQYQFYRYGYMDQKGEILYISDFFVCEDRSGSFPNALNLYDHFIHTDAPIIIIPKEEDFITISLDPWLICSPSESIRDFSKQTINAKGDYYVGENQTITFVWVKKL